VSRLLIVASLAMPASTLAQPRAGHPLIGRQMATALCAPAIRQVKTRHDGPPSFLDVANWHSTKTLSSSVFSPLKLQGDAYLIISDSETDDLIAYIINLKQPSAPKRP
jgi:hypothetical protein